MFRFTYLPGDSSDARWRWRVCGDTTMAMDPVGARRRREESHNSWLAPPVDGGLPTVLLARGDSDESLTVVSALVAPLGVSSMAQAPQVPLFAFASPDAAAEWQTVNDGVMGGVSDGRFRMTERQTLEFYGTLSLKNNGGFASVRSRPRTLELQTGDTLVARVRGDGREYPLNQEDLAVGASG